MTLKSVVSSNFRPLLIIGITAIASIFYWSFLISSQQLELDTARHRGELHVQQLNEAVDQQLDATFRSVDTVLRHLRSVYVNDRKLFDRSVQDALSAYPKGMLQYAIVIGPDGYLAYSSDTKPGEKQKSIFMGDREHFLVQSESKEDHLFISKPIIGRISGSPLIQNTRPIWDGQRFLGVIGIPLHPDFISNNLWSLHIDQHDLISVVREDGRIIARSRKLEEGLKLTTPSGRPFMHSHPGDHGIFRSTSITDNIPLLFSWRHLVNYPIIAVTAIDESADLKGIFEQQSATKDHALLSLLLVNLFAGWISVLLIRVNRKKQEAEKSEQRYRTLINHNNAIILQILPNTGKIFDANQSACQFYGWTREQLCAMSIHEIIQLSPAQINLEIEAASRENRNYFLFPHRLANGELRMVEVHSTPVDDGVRLTHVLIIHDVTQRIYSDKKIANLLQEQDAILNSEIVGIAKIADRKIIWTNTTFAEMLGYLQDELIGQSTQITFSSAEAYSSFGRQAYPVLLRGEVYRTDIQFRRKDGSLGWYDIDGSLLSLESNEFIWSLVDITERKNGEVALFESEQRWKFALEGAAEGVWERNLQTNEIKVTKQFEVVLGYAEGEFGTNGDLWRKSIHPDDLPHAIGTLTAYLENKASSYFNEYRLLCKDGNYKWVLSRGIVVERDATGTPTKLIGTLSDISVRKQAEAELRIAATAFESQEGMSITDANGTILRVNRAFTTITGYSAEEVVGQNPRILNSGRQDASFYSEMWESITRKGSWEGEIWNRRKNGEVFPEHLTITAVAGSNGVITNYVATLNDITRSKAADDKIKHLAFYDPLTRLPNRRLLLDRLAHELASITRSGCSGALLFIDLDNFKTLNDTLGHDVGDILLQQVAKRLESCVREVDTVARLGGDEFLVMLVNLSKNTLEAAEQTENIGKKILHSLNNVYQLASHEYANTPSIGATLFSNNAQSIDELLKQADIAMYQSKKTGRNNLHFFDPTMQEAVNFRAKLENELSKALKNNQLELHYQLQVESHQPGEAYRSCGAEALIRWLHPEHGLIFPGQFIALAEETGLIIPIGQWVLETACHQLNVWQKNFQTRDLILAVNVSARQFRQPDFAAQVKAIVELQAIDPSKLKLELTESVLLEDIEDTIVTMNALKKIGVLFSLDDFGTGYSSLQYLKRLPFNQLKIDQSFVRDIDTNNGDRAIVRTIIAMAKSLNMAVIAEGVETEEHLHILLEMGCTHHQGYLFGKPMPLRQFEVVLD